MTGRPQRRMKTGSGNADQKGTRATAREQAARDAGPIWMKRCFPCKVCTAAGGRAGGRRLRPGEEQWQEDSAASRARDVGFPSPPLSGLVYAARLNPQFIVLREDADSPAASIHGLLARLARVSSDLAAG